MDFTAAKKRSDARFLRMHKIIFFVLENATNARILSHDILKEDCPLSFLSLQHISKVYQTGEERVFALQDVSLSIQEGEFAAIVGSSGSGKSTMMNVMGCLDMPTQGEYYLNHERIFEMREAKLSAIRNRTIGFIFQGFHLIPTLTALENVELPLIYRGMEKKRRRRLAKEALERVGLEKRMLHFPSEMSGGQQQRTAIARAVAASPPLLLADEPTGNLDSRAGNEIMQILTGLHREGRTMALITHDPKIAKMADRIIEIQDGRIIRDCPS